MKKECVGHVQKCVGTALRKLKKAKKGMGGKGKLTDSMINSRTFMGLQLEVMLAI